MFFQQVAFPSYSALNSLNALKFNTKGCQNLLGRQPSYRKCMWTEAEDKLLKDAVQQHGVKNWSLISTLVPGRNGKQCRERWSGMLDPELAKEAWSLEEDQLLIKLHSEFGNKWAKISTFLPGRSRISLRNRWSYHVRHNFQRINEASESEKMKTEQQISQPTPNNSSSSDEYSSENPQNVSDSQNNDDDPFNFIKFDCKYWDDIDQLTGELTSQLLFETNS